MLTQDPSEPVLTPTHLITAQTAYLGACVVAAHPTVAGELDSGIAVRVHPRLIPRYACFLFDSG